MNKKSFKTGDAWGKLKQLILETMSLKVIKKAELALVLIFPKYFSGGWKKFVY